MLIKRLSSHPKLTSLELQIMEALWNHGASSVREIQERFPEPGRPAYTTVQTTVYRLERKGAVKCVKRISNANIFNAAISREDAQGRLVDDIVGLFGGQARPVMARLIESGKLTLDDIKDAERTLRSLSRKERRMSSAFYSGLLNHLWQSTLFAGFAGLLTLALKSNRAAVRYRIWFVASVKFLIPFSLLFSLGSRIPLPAPKVPPAPLMTPISGSAAVEPATPSLAENISRPLAAIAPAASPAVSFAIEAEWPRRLVQIALVIWLAGMLFSFAIWLRQWLRVRARVRTALPLELDVPARIPALSSASAIEPSVFGILRPVLLLPANITSELPSNQIEAILLHESAHVDRSDNLGAAIHMVVEALFWFDPVVWWIGKRLVEERERACDEQVLHGFEAPETYAEAILNVCKLHVKTPLVCMSGVASSNLRERIEQIMNHRKPLTLNVGRKLMLSLVVSLAVLAPTMAGMLNARQAPNAPLGADSAYSFSSIEVPGSTSTLARGIDPSGRIVGSFTDQRGTHGFLYNGGRFTTIDVPGSPWTIAIGINSGGQIVGAHGAGTEMGNHGFLLSGGNFSSIDVPGSLDTIASGVNSRGQIVGTYLALDGMRHGFRLSSGNYATIEVPDSRAGSADGINDAGQIVGSSGIGASAVGFFFDGRSYAKIQPVANVYTRAVGLNNLGGIVGQSGGPQAPFQGFLYTGDNSSPLVLPGTPSSWSALGVNDLGQIVGSFADRDGKMIGFLAAPTAFRTMPAPSTSAPGGPNVNANLNGPRGNDGGRGRGGSPVLDGVDTNDGGRGSRGGSANPRVLTALRGSFERTMNGIRRNDSENVFQKRAEAAVLRAIDAINSALTLAGQHPEILSAPAIPPKKNPEFEPPEFIRGGFPGRMVTLNQLKGDFEELNKTPGGDLGGAREKIHEEIANAARETILDMVHEHLEREFNQMRGTLQRANNNIERQPDDGGYAPRAHTAVNQAIEDIAAVLVYIVEHPSIAPAPTPLRKPSFAPPAADRGRYPGRETALSNLSSAFDTINNAPGGDFGGLRAKIQTEINLAADEMLASIREASKEKK